jgi:hypothetical protein
LPNPTHYERVGLALSTYRDEVEESIKELRNRLYLSVFNVLVILGLVTAAVFWSNVAGILASLGLGGTNVAAERSNWTKTAKEYMKDKGKLRRIVRRLERKYALCTPADDESLAEVEFGMEKSYDDVDSALK